MKLFRVICIDNSRTNLKLNKIYKAINYNSEYYAILKNNDIQKNQAILLKDRFQTIEKFRNNRLKQLI